MVYTPLTHYKIPLRKVIVTHDVLGIPADFDISSSTHKIDIWMRENAVDTAELILTDEGQGIFDNIMDYDDVVKIYLNYSEVEDPLTKASLRFYGFVEDMTPFLSERGEFLKVNLRSYGRCVVDLLCGDQYGSNSLNSALDTSAEILNDTSNGIIPAWTNKLHNAGAAGSSGYSLDYSLIEDVDSGSNDIVYLYNPYKPNKNVIDDLIDLQQAVKGASTAGPHWIIRTVENPAGTFTHYFLFTTVGNHASSPNVAAKWPTWFNTDQDHSTIRVKQDMIVQNFCNQRPEANYVLYHGLFRKPGDGDSWTEAITGWGVQKNATSTFSAVSSPKKVGSNSLKATSITGTSSDYYWWPSSEDWSLDITKIGGSYNPATINLFMQYSLTSSQRFYVNMRTGTTKGDNCYQYDLTNMITINNQWFWGTLPLGNFEFFQEGFHDFKGWSTVGSPDWTDIDCIEIEVRPSHTVSTFYYWDGLYLAGHVLRGAYKSGASHYKSKRIDDEYAKDDSLLATDDSYPMAQLAYAELLRCARTPITGEILIPAQPSILAGQKAHIEACKTTAGAYRIDKDIRILEHHLIFTAPTGFHSHLTLTDDLYNSRPMSPKTAYNLLEKASAPEFQTRQHTTIKTRDVDITQQILEKAYTFSYGF